MNSWLVPLKVASIEALLGSFSAILGRPLPYGAFGEFERQTAQVFALLGESETRFVLERLVDATHLEASSRLRARRPDQPLRLSTLVPEDRQHLLSATLAGLVHRNPGDETL